MKPKNTTINEQWFRQFWQYQLLDAGALQTENGEPVRVLYPGRPNDLRGPDFRDAVIETGDERRHGDIEIHLRSGDWQNHHHHQDRYYNRVILHVVMRHTPKRNTVLENGEEIPILTLSNPEIPKGRRIRRRQQQPVPCSGAGSGNTTDRLIDSLKEAGIERFQQKAAIMAKRVERDGEAQTLYGEMMEALGYAANKIPFRELAGRLTLKELDQAVHGTENRNTAIPACLFGAAGFLREDFQARLTAAGINDRQRRILAQYWQQTSGEVRVAPDRWQLFRIRPNNSPFVRLAAMSTLLDRTRPDGFLQHIKTVITTGLVATDIKPIVDDLITLSNAKNIGKESGTVTQLGTERACTIVINVLLPFALAASLFDKQKVLDTWQNCRKSAENSLERHMREQFGLEKRTIKTAGQQQGLIHIYKTRCTQGMCDECEIRTFS